jgi:hypothetical protein
MNHSGDAAEQIVRMSLEGVEVAAKITGAAAKEIALLLLAALKSPEQGAGGLKPRGRARHESMLKSGKALEIFSVRESDLRTFVREAKNYGIVYCVLRNAKHSPDGLCDIMVKADDAPKINRIVERFKFASVDKAKIESEIVRDTEIQAAEVPMPEDAEPEINDIDRLLDELLGAEPGEPEINDIDELLGELLGAEDGKAEPEKSEADKETDAPAQDAPNAPDAPKEPPATPEPEKPAPKKSGRGTRKEPVPATDERKEQGPLASGGGPATDNPPQKTSPSRPSSESRKNSEKAMSSKPSVKAELREIAAAQKAKEAEARKREEPAAAKPKETQATTHTQPKNRRKPKKSKGR